MVNLTEVLPKTGYEAMTAILLDILGPAPEITAGHGGGERRMLIDGELVEGAGGASFTNSDPATGEALGEVCDGTAADMERAIGAARRAFDETSWRRDSQFRRHCLKQLSQALRTNAALMRAALVSELGAPVRLAANVHVDPVADKLAFLEILGYVGLDT